MNDSFEEKSMSLTLNERSNLIFEQLKDSYTFWYIKKAIKEELIKNPNAAVDLGEIIPKLLTQLNLDTKIKNKVQEVLAKNGYFKENITVAKNKFKNCVDSSFLPSYFTEKEFEPMASVANARRTWNEQIKHKLNNFVRQTRKPFVVKKATGSTDGKTEYPKPEKSDEPGANQVFDANSLLDAVLKVSNYAGYHNLSWGSVKLQLQTLSIEEIRKKFSEMNVTLRQIGVDDEKSFIDERILIGERLL